MNKLIKTLVLGGALLATQAVQAAWTENDLVLGFNKGIGATPPDYAINLGQATSVGIGGSSIVNLSSGYGFSISTFNSTYSGGLSSGVTMGLAGGLAGDGGLFVTQPRLGLGNPVDPGSTAPGVKTADQLGQGVGSVLAFVELNNLVGGSFITIAPNLPLSYNAYFLSAGSTEGGSLWDNTSINVNFGGTGPLYQDIWFAQAGVNSQSWSYKGFLTFDPTATGSELTFTPFAAVPVPEPSTYGLLAGAGLLALTLRRRLQTNKA